MKIYTVFAITILFVVGCQPSQDQNKVGESSDDLKYRPQYHFTPPSQWMNDPNGMVYYEGEYHLFYQHYPDSNVWGPMHWGHAVSPDIMNWEHLPIALYPDELGYIFSGSAVIDWNNTSGLGSTDNPAMVAIYTYHDPVGAEAGKVDYQTQGIAYSLDKGRSWTKYEANPVLENPGIIDFRDPKVAWNEEKEAWIMTLAVKDHIEFFSSPDLIHWKKESEFGSDLGAHGGVWECPDLFELTTSEGVSKWILLVSINPGGPQKGSATQYFIGDFDGSVFTPDDEEVKWIDLGADNYAGVTWSDVPEEDGRRLFIGWMSNWQYANIVPTYEWRSAMTLPRELQLEEIGGEYYVKSVPVDEIADYVNQTETYSPGELPELAKIDLDDITSDSLRITLSNKLGEAVVITISENQVAFDRTRSGKTDFEEGFAAVHTYENFLESVNQATIYLDRSSIELFINNGSLVMTELVFPNEPYSKLTISGETEVSVYSVNTIWEDERNQ